ncbi:hypothetical protein AZE42_07643 [Rhizopogon vesiculosus]|uniref:Uncharacterized protein n=1 Tax=Rhizopogon vesiculosus TaxID=180088 RepID=A0A1J8QE69_9AGAM|nr:hypothetical protein AZE42_07643 [Rhizopogon vesiculosus]
MSSTIPAPSSSNPTHQVQSPNLAGNNCASWRSRAPQQPQNAYPPPPAPHHAASVQELLSMDTLCLPPFWETPRDSNLTVALIRAQRSERRAEARLIKHRLKRVKVELELYTHMEQQTNPRLHKVNNSVGITRGGLRACGMFPLAGEVSQRSRQPSTFKANLPALNGTLLGECTYRPPACPLSHNLFLQPTHAQHAAHGVCETL